MLHAEYGVSKGEKIDNLVCYKMGYFLPFGRLEGPGTIRKVPGGSLHTFSPVRKYDICVYYTVYRWGLPRQFENWLAMTRKNGRQLDKLKFRGLQMLWSMKLILAFSIG